MKFIKEKWFIIVFFLLMAFPLYGGIVDRNITLSGVTATPEPVVMTAETLGNGSYQTYLNDVWESDFPGKKILLKIRNQILYSVCQVSPNKNVIVGKDGYLYEPNYILFENQTYPPNSEEYFATLGTNLAQLKTLLEQNGKELYVFVTPSKADYCKEYIPDRYMALNHEDDYDYTNYSKLIEILDGNAINYFDSIAYINENLDTETEAGPLFYASGIHWNHAWGNRAAAQFLDYMDTKSKYDLSSVSVTTAPSDVPVYPDTDLYDSLNLLLPAEDNWYQTATVIDEAGADYPKVFYRGGSFMGQSLNSLIKAGVFSEDVHFENNYYFMDNYSLVYNLSAFNAYEEIDLDSLLGKSDILVLEVNDGAIYTMSWGFIEHLLEHPEYLDYNYEAKEN